MLWSGRTYFELARRSFRNINGFDRSYYLIQKARKSAKKQGLEFGFEEGDARKTPYVPDSFNSVMIFGNSFGYFETLEEDLRVLQEEGTSN